MIKVKDRFRCYPKDNYRVKKRYRGLLNSPTNPHWNKTLWTRISLPRHTITAWLLMHQKLPVVQRIGRFTQQTNMECKMCQQSSESQEHLFFTSQKANEIWRETLRDWGIQL